MNELDYYGVNLLLYEETAAKAIKNRIDILLDRVYFPEPDKKIIFDSRLSTDELYQLNKEKAEELAWLFERSPARIILRKADRDKMKWHLKRENLLDGIKIIQELKGAKKDDYK